MIERGEKPPERTANALYLEWFSESHGRVVIESADYELDISAPEWRLSDAEEKQRMQEAGWKMFCRQLNDTHAGRRLHASAQEPLLRERAEILARVRSR